jgi:hypothetical protein
MEQTEYTCKDCVLMNDEDFGSHIAWVKTHIHT